MATSKKTDIQLASLLERAGIDERWQTRQLRGGRNNQVFLVETPSDKFVAKLCFFDSAGDTRDRFLAETSFLSFANEILSPNVPDLIAVDADNRALLMKFIPGNSFSKYSLQPTDVEAARVFFKELNQHREHELAKKLPYAAEASLSIETSIASVERRIKDFVEMQIADETDKDAFNFIGESLIPAWARVVEEKLLPSPPEFLNQPLSAEELCISPSDFGFHNALKRQNDEIVFFDFEYAGLDDPAKMLADFFTQVRIPVPLSYFADVYNDIQEVCPNTKQLAKRLSLMLPIHQIKWCCLLLNEFSTIGQKRRRFAGVIDNSRDTREKQLEKSKQLLAKLSEKEELLDAIR